NDNYFGHSAGEAQRGGLARYRAGSGVAPSMDVTALMPLGAHWTATASLRRTLLTSAVKDSPMTRGDHMDTALLALT
ncbi:MipA/OmpV family protein, partial [Stenotrophomonas sp. GbtcB23]|uniref:MipA/OmpV family protein n=1 Tax=Stenotrophomonas sp. GbtcB23 TaxID=2824768 RepID=UPI001C2F60A6